MKKFNKLLLLPLSILFMFTLASCGDKKSEEIYEIDDCSITHDVVKDEAIYATFTSTGLTEGLHCARCGEVFLEQHETPILGSADLYINIDDLIFNTPNGYNNYDCELYLSLNKYANIYAYGSINDLKFMIENDNLYVLENTEKSIIKRSDIESNYTFIYDIIDSIKDSYQTFEILNINNINLDDGVIKIMDFNEDDVINMGSYLNTLLFDLNAFDALSSIIPGEIVKNYIDNGYEIVNGLISLSKIVSFNNLLKNIDEKLGENFNLEDDNDDLYPNIKFVVDVLNKIIKAFNNEYENFDLMLFIELIQLFYGNYSVYDLLGVYGYDLSDINEQLKLNNLYGEESILYSLSIMEVISLFSNLSIDDLNEYYNLAYDGLLAILPGVKINGVVNDEFLNKIIIDINIDDNVLISETSGNININIGSYNEVFNIYSAIK